MIKLNDITKKYGETVILEHTDFTFPKKGLVCLMGASGGGKTTLLNLLAGFDSDYDGTITIDGTSISQMNADALCSYRRDNIGFIFQNYHLLSGYTVLENVLLANELKKDTCKLENVRTPLQNGNSEDALQKARTLLEKLGISAKENEKIENLSGGQKQRVAIARALISNPQILLADEPTGALDRTNSTQIMELLKEISMDRLVIVITHDQKICDFADEVIHIKDKKIIREKGTAWIAESDTHLISNPPAKTSMLTLAAKNFKVHLKRFIAVSLAISIGMLAFLFSLSFGNVMEQSIEEFKTKNTAFNNGYIKGVDDGTILSFLQKDERITNIYYQYKLEQIALTLENRTETIPEKFPTPKATEALSYGVMPRKGMNEIALTPSLAKKFATDIKSLLGKEMTFVYSDQKHTLLVSGIYNAGYDDFMISSDIEQQLYTNMGEQENYSINYDVKNFSDIVAVSNSLKLRGIDSKTAVDEVYTLQNTFASLNQLFLIISILVLGIGLFICIVLLIKLQNTRYNEVGLLSALGFRRSQITSLILQENVMLSSLATVVNLILLGCGLVISKVINFPLIITVVQVILCVVITFSVVLLVSGAISYKLIHTEPAEALRK